MSFDYIVTQRQTQSSTLSGGLGGEEGLEDFIRAFCGIPLPLSLTLISTLLPIFFVLIETVGSYFSPEDEFAIGAEVDKDRPFLL